MRTLFCPVRERLHINFSARRMRRLVSRVRLYALLIYYDLKQSHS
jgi:hypothetical protein